MIRYSAPVLFNLGGPAYWMPWVHDTSATPARVLWRWDNVMASSALRSALRFTACMQAVNLKTKLRQRLTGRRRRSVVNFGATPGLPRSGRVTTSLSGLSNGGAPATVGWPLQAGAPAGPAKQRGQRPCDGTFPRADRWPTGAGTWSRHHQPRVNLSFHLSSYSPEGLLASPAAAP